jgi:hypothetical protein
MWFQIIFSRLEAIPPSPALQQLKKAQGIRWTYPLHKNPRNQNQMRVWNKANLRQNWVKGERVQDDTGEMLWSREELQVARNEAPREEILKDKQEKVNYNRNNIINWYKQRKLNISFNVPSLSHELCDHFLILSYETQPLFYCKVEGNRFAIMEMFPQPISILKNGLIINWAP